MISIQDFQFNFFQEPYYWELSPEAGRTHTSSFLSTAIYLCIFHMTGQKSFTPTCDYSFDTQIPGTLGKLLLPFVCDIIVVKYRSVKDCSDE